MPRIGFMTAGLAAPRVDVADAFRDGLRDHGYVEGDNIVVEWRSSHDGSGGRFSDLASDLVALSVRIIVTCTTGALVAAAQASRSIPIVDSYSRDPIDLGLAESYAHPGRNVTGTGSNSAVYNKLLELLKQAVPSVGRVGHFRNPDTPGTAQEMARVQATAQPLGIEVLEVQVRAGDEIEAALRSAVVAGVNGLIVSGDVVFNDRRATSLPQRYGLPAIYSQVEGYVDQGGLLGYSIDVAAAVRRSAAYVDKLLKGANPADLPIEQAMNFQLAVNLKTARELAVTIPDDVLLQATEVIQ